MAAGLAGAVVALAISAAAPAVTEDPRPGATSPPDVPVQTPLGVRPANPPDQQSTSDSDDQDGSRRLDAQDADREILIRDPDADERVEDHTDPAAVPEQVLLDDLQALTTGETLELGDCHIEITATDVLTTGCELELIPAGHDPV